MYRNRKTFHFATNKFLHVSFPTNTLRRTLLIPPPLSPAASNDVTDEEGNTYRVGRRMPSGGRRRCRVTDPDPGNNADDSVRPYA